MVEGNNLKPKEEGVKKVAKVDGVKKPESYIVDLDCVSRNTLRPFVQMLFSHPKILKLGFKFEHDLAELRKAVSLIGCGSLRDPINLSCILLMIEVLMEETEKVSYAPEILAEFGMGDNSGDVTVASRLDRRSMSSFCESLLGLPLENRENSAQYG
ncbi:hypothetical protein PENTCL1PPCAC_18829, partial [Pristionchus entomophagus]